MNNYLKILSFLKDFDVNGGFHNLNPIFEELYNVTTEKELLEEANKRFLEDPSSHPDEYHNDSLKKPKFTIGKISKTFRSSGIRWTY